MKLLFKILFPVLILVGSVFGAKTILENRPEPRTRPSFPTIPAVEAQTLKTGDYPVVIRSQGTVQATQSTTLVAEVTGTIVTLSEKFVVGGSFKAGDLLLQIDERDYAIALTQAEANLAQAVAALEEESARGQLAKQEWASLGRGQEASAMTLRLPQLAAARAARASARAQVDRAKLDLERTRFFAPFDGQVLEADVDQGQFVSRGNRLGQIYATSSVDIKLPLSSRQMTFLDLPRPGDDANVELPSIELIASVGGQELSYLGKVVRAEGVDTATQQLNVIARVERPTDANTPPLRIGQYVIASINGRVLKDVFVLPRTALREDREVLLVNDESKLVRQEVEVAWLDEQTAAISGGLESGAILVTTALSTVTNGTPVRATIDGVAPPPTRRGPPGGQRGQGQAGQGQGGEGQAGQGQRRQGQQGQGQRRQGQEGQGQAGQGQRRQGQEGQGQRRQGQAEQADQTQTETSPRGEIQRGQGEAGGEQRDRDEGGDGQRGNEERGGQRDEAEQGAET